MQKQCCSCKMKLDTSKFYKNSRHRDGLSSRCIACQKEYHKHWHATTRSRLSKDRNKILKEEKKLAASEYVAKLKTNAPCSDCGLYFHPCQMDFDHLRDKVDNVSAMVNSGLSIPAIQAEIDKCELVCSNCHRLRTWMRRNDRT